MGGSLLGGLRWGRVVTGSTLYQRVYPGYNLGMRCKFVWEDIFRISSTKFLIYFCSILC